MLIADSQGRHVRQFTAPARQGLNRVVWNLRRDGFKQFPVPARVRGRRAEPVRPRGAPRHLPGDRALRRPGGQGDGQASCPTRAGRPSAEDLRRREEAIQRTGDLQDCPGHGPGAHPAHPRGRPVGDGAARQAEEGRGGPGEGRGPGQGPPRAEQEGREARSARRGGRQGPEGSDRPREEGLAAAGHAGHPAGERRRLQGVQQPVLRPLLDWTRRARPTWSTCARPRPRWPRC